VPAGSNNEMASSRPTTDQKGDSKQRQQQQGAPQDEDIDMQSLGLFMDAVPFQTLSSIAAGLENRLDELAASMFDPPVSTEEEVVDDRHSTPMSPSSFTRERSPTMSELEERASKPVFLTETIEPQSSSSVNPRQSMPTRSVEDLRVDYLALISAPQPPPNVDPAALMKNVSNQIEFPKQWMRDSWNEHFLSEASLSIMQDLFWWFFNDQFALIQHSLANQDSNVLQPIDPPPNHNKAQAVMFDRMSDCYTKLFWTVGLTMLTDEFFERFTEALADAVREAYDQGLEESKHLFTDPSCNRDAILRDTLVKWTTAIAPRRAQPKTRVSHNVRCGRFDAVGHSPLMANYMRRHGCVAPIGVELNGRSGAVHKLHRLEVALRPPKKKSPLTTRKEEVNEEPKAIEKPAKSKATSAVPSSTALPPIANTCGMGTLSQKKVDEVILGYLN